jgi:hypothetical protein
MSCETSHCFAILAGERLLHVIMCVIVLRAANLMPTCPMIMMGLTIPRCSNACFSGTVVTQGAKKQGMKSHIRAKKKFDNLGVGQAEAAKRAQDWTLDMCKFSSALSSLQEVVSKHAAASDSDDDSSTAEEQVADSAAVVVGAIVLTSATLALQTQPVVGKIANDEQSERKLHKKRRTSKLDKGSNKVANAAVEPAEAAQDKQTAAAPCAASPPASEWGAAARSVKRAKHSGRYSKRERNKLVKGYSATDLAAILGHTAPGVLSCCSCPLYLHHHRRSDMQGVVFISTNNVGLHQIVHLIERLLRDRSPVCS